MQSYLKNYPVTSRPINTPLSAIAGAKQYLGKRQQGTNLIELMITLMVLAILAAIALPYYGHYVKKAELAEPQVLFSGIKTALEVYYSQKGHFPGPIEFDQLGLVTVGNEVIETQYHDDMVSPRIEMFLIDFPIGENTIAWSWKTDGMMNGSWSCKPENSGTTIRYEYLPSPCKS